MLYHDLFLYPHPEILVERSLALMFSSDEHPLTLDIMVRARMVSSHLDMSNLDAHPTTLFITSKWSSNDDILLRAMSNLANNLFLSSSLHPRLTDFSLVMTVGTFYLHLHTLFFLSSFLLMDPILWTHCNKTFSH